MRIFLLFFISFLVACGSTKHTVYVEPQEKKEDVVIDIFYVIHGNDIQIKIFKPSKGYSIRDLEMIGEFLEIDMKVSDVFNDGGWVAMPIKEWIGKVEPLLIEYGVPVNMIETTNGLY